MSGTYDGSLPSSPYQLDFYATPACDGSGNGEGGTWLGSQSSLSDGAGDFSFNTDNLLTGNVAPGAVITATATDTLGDTSEFSACKQVPGAAGSTLTVDTTDGSTDGSCSDGDCSLGDAITVANAVPGTDTIDVQPARAVSRDHADSVAPGDHGRGRDRRDDTARVLGDVAGRRRRRRDDDRRRLRRRHGYRRQHDSRAVHHGFPRRGHRPDRAAVGRRGQLHRRQARRNEPGGNGSGSTFHGGILVGSEGNRIGGTTAATRNVISGNTPSGIVITDGAGNLILGNRIGTNVTATMPCRTPGTASTSADPLGVPTIGAGGPGAGNLISGNKGSGIWIEAGDGAVIQGNTVGLAVDGSTALPNGADGIHAEFAGGRIGGVGPGEGNVVSGNGGAGIALITVSSPTKMQGNLVGLKASGDALAPNGAGQVVVSASDSIDIGGATAAARNVISGGGSSTGVLLDSGTHDVLVQGNYIGTDSTGEVGLGNGEGVSVTGGAHDNTIGGSVPGTGNVISASSQIGLSLDLAGTGNRVLGNSIGTDKDETDGARRTTSASSSSAPREPPSAARSRRSGT